MGNNYEYLKIQVYFLSVKYLHDMRVAIVIEVISNVIQGQLTILLISAPLVCDMP